MPTESTCKQRARKEHTVNGIVRNMFPRSGTRAEHNGYLAAIQTRDGRIQLINSKNHYVFNLAWLKALPERHVKCSAQSSERSDA